MSTTERNVVKSSVDPVGRITLLPASLLMRAEGKKSRHHTNQYEHTNMNTNMNTNVRNTSTSITMILVRGFADLVDPQTQAS